MKNKSHPNHFSDQKSFFQNILGLGLPLFLFWAYFQFYNFGKITPSEMVKTTGLLAISLLSLTLVIGPACRFFPSLEPLKSHRKTWGIASFLAALTHTLLILIYFFNFNFLKFIDTSNPKFLGFLLGSMALFILLVVTLTSFKRILYSLDPKIWKMIQTTSYLALFFAVAHFYLVESKDGVLVIKRLFGQITFAFAGFVVLLRLLVMILPTKLK